MITNNIFYHGIIRKCIVVFGTLFSNIKIERKVGDSVTGNTTQTIKVPISWTPREKWMRLLEEVPSEDDKGIMTKLPRMGFQISGYSYDSTRKVGKMNRIACAKNGEMFSTIAPTPYNIDIELNVITKTYEDGLQIIEQILPYFQPEFTLSIKAVPELNIVQDVPIILNGISIEDQWDGDFTEKRFIVHTLNFTMKTNLFGAVRDTNWIERALINFNNMDPEKELAKLEIFMEEGQIVETYEEFE
jgi:hypothetical protein